MDVIKLCIISTALDVTEGIFAVLYVSIMGLTRFYKTTVFLHLCIQTGPPTGIQRGGIRPIVSPISALLERLVSFPALKIGELYSTPQYIPSIIMVEPYSTPENT